MVKYDAQENQFYITSTFFASLRESFPEIGTDIPAGQVVVFKGASLNIMFQTLTPLNSDVKDNSLVAYVPGSIYPKDKETLHPVFRFQNLRLPKTYELQLYLKQNLV